jgi:hypothetical protein
MYTKWKLSPMMCMKNRKELSKVYSRPRDADGGDGLQIWRKAANILEQAVMDSR